MQEMKIESVEGLASAIADMKVAKRELHHSDEAHEC